MTQRKIVDTLLAEINGFANMLFIKLDLNATCTIS